MPVISIKRHSVGCYTIEHTIEPLKNKTLLEERGLTYNLKTKRKQRMTEKQKNTTDNLLHVSDRTNMVPHDNLKNNMSQLSKAERTKEAEKDKKDIQNFVNALYVNTAKNMKSLG